MMSVCIGEQTYFTISDIAKETGRSTQTINRWIKNKKIPPPMRIKSNNWRVFTRDHVEKIVAYSRQIVKDDSK